MSFHRIDLLPNFDAVEARQAMSRWVGADHIAGKVVQFFRAQDLGSVQGEFEAGHLGFVKDKRDLAGIDIFGESFNFPRIDSLEDVDFSYSKFGNCTFSSAVFLETKFIFSRLYNVEFRSCVFNHAHFYGTAIEKCKFIDCDFVGENGFSNCDFMDVKFSDCFFNKNKFVDCRVDENVYFISSGGRRLLGLLLTPSSGFDERLEKTNISGIYRGIKESYSAGQIQTQVRHFLFLQQQAFTRYNQMGVLNRSKGYAWEIIAGYGTRPIRVLLCFCVLYLIVSLRFACALGIHGHLRDAFLLSSGAFLTFGAKTELLATMSRFDNVLYTASAFVGISMVALLITVMTNLLLKDS